MKKLLQRLSIVARKIVLDFVWMGFGLYVILTSGTNTPNPTAREIWYALGLGVLGTGFIRFIGHVWGDDTEQALEKILAEQTAMREEMRAEIKELRELIEIANDQKQTILHTQDMNQATVYEQSEHLSSTRL